MNDRQRAESGYRQARDSAPSLDEFRSIFRKESLRVAPSRRTFKARPTTRRRGEENERRSGESPRLLSAFFDRRGAKRLNGAISIPRADGTAEFPANYTPYICRHLQAHPKLPIRFAPVPDRALSSDASPLDPAQLLRYFRGIGLPPRGSHVCGRQI